MNHFDKLPSPYDKRIQQKHYFKYREIKNFGKNMCLEICDMVTKKNFKIEFERNKEYYIIPDNLVINSEKKIGLLDYPPSRRFFSINGEFYRKLNQWEADEYEYNMLAQTENAKIFGRILQILTEIRKT